MFCDSNTSFLSAVLASIGSVALISLSSMQQLYLHLISHILFWLTSQQGTCKFVKSKVKATVSGHVDIEEGSESKLQVAVATVGPVSVAIDASQRSFQSYRGGTKHVLSPNFSSTVGWVVGQKHKLGLAMSSQVTEYLIKGTSISYFNWLSGINFLCVMCIHFNFFSCDDCAFCNWKLSQFCIR